jgi:hypothetical protein
MSSMNKDIQCDCKDDFRSDPIWFSEDRFQGIFFSKHVGVTHLTFPIRRGGRK